MGQALVKGILRAGKLSPDRVHVSDADEQRCRTFATQWVLNAGSNREVAEAADAVIIAVKPPQVPGVLQEIGPHLKEGALVISIAAGVPLATLESALGRPLPVIRAMPNTPCLIGEGAVALSLGRWADAEHGRWAASLFEAVAAVVQVPEYQMDAVTGLSGSGPAYVFKVIEALIDAGVMAGLDRATARKLVVHTVAGSARLVAETGEHPMALKDAVTSPGGTTIAGLAVLERRAVASAFIDAVQEAARRSAELGRQSASTAQRPGPASGDTGGGPPTAAYGQGS